LSEADAETVTGDRLTRPVGPVIRVLGDTLSLPQPPCVVGGGGGVGVGDGIGAVGVEGTEGG
jgi:hypothetical protein